MLPDLPIECWLAAARSVERAWRLRRFSFCKAIRNAVVNDPDYWRLVVVAWRPGSPWCSISPLRRQHVNARLRISTKRSALHKRHAA